MKVNKLDKAHDFVMNCIQNPTVKLNDENLQNIISNAWKYADLMQEEYDKRNNARLENNKKLLEDAENKVWQPDWGVAPDNMFYFAVDKNGEGWFFNKEPHIERDNCWYCGDDAFKIKQHNYKGDWEQSLRERPEIPKVEVESKQHSCNCPHWKGSSFFMGDTFTCNDCGGVVMI